MSLTPELAIRTARAAFNRALAAGDLAAIAPILARDAMLVTGTDSAILSGRRAQLAAWTREFAASNRAVYTRTPERILVSAVEPIAFEQGHWRSTRIEGGRSAGEGVYTAKWREIDGRWQIEAELFVTLVG